MATIQPAQSGQADGACVDARRAANPIFSLSTLADVQNGYAIKAKWRTDGLGNLSLVQGKDASCALAQALERALVPKVPEQHLLRPGDVVFTIRGSSNPAALVTSVTGASVCTAELARIRIHDPNRLLPAYLAWFLNAPATQAMLEQHSRINTIRVVPAKVLQEVDIVLPSLRRQQKIVDAWELNLQIIAKEMELRAKSREYTDALLMRMARFE